MSRPFVWMFAISSSVMVIAARAVRDLHGRHLGGDRDGLGHRPTSSVSLPRSRTSVDNRLMSATVSALKLASSTAERVAAWIERGDSEAASLVGGRRSHAAGADFGDVDGRAWKRGARAIHDRT